MNKHTFRRVIADTFQRIEDLTATKGEEYSRRDEASQFENFENIAAELHLTREQILWVYLRKHMQSINTYINDKANDSAAHVTLSEPIIGRIDDAILYLILLRAMVIDHGVGEQMFGPDDKNNLIDRFSQLPPLPTFGIGGYCFQFDNLDKAIDELNRVSRIYANPLNGTMALMVDDDTVAEIFRQDTSIQTMVKTEHGAVTERFQGADAGEFETSQPPAEDDTGEEAIAIPGFQLPRIDDVVVITQTFDPSPRHKDDYVTSDYGDTSRIKRLNERDYGWLGGGAIRFLVDACEFENVEFRKSALSVYLGVQYPLVIDGPKHVFASELNQLPARLCHIFGYRRAVNCISHVESLHGLARGTRVFLFDRPATPDRPEGWMAPDFHDMCKSRGYALSVFDASKINRMIDLLGL